MNKSLWVCGLSLLLLAPSCTSNRQEQPPAEAVKNYLNESREQRDERMAWWRQDRFGMFIHWGLYAVPAGEYQGKRSDQIGEWIQSWANIPRADYAQYAKQFNPVKFDAAEWVSLAKNAGMKYIVITSKHHEGFSMWDSQVSDYDIVDSTPLRQGPDRGPGSRVQETGGDALFLPLHHGLASSFPVR